MTSPLVLGLDVGGTSTRVVVADLGGRILGAADGDGGNPVAYGEAAAVRSIADTLHIALAEVDPAGVAAGVIGLAGGSVASPALAEVWPAAGLRTVPRLVGDVQLAFAAGTAGPAGSVLVSGTGAVAAECRDHAPVRLADGHGWLLGDRGSGYWLGRAAVQLTLAALDSGADTSTGLPDSIITALLTDVPSTNPSRQAVVGAVHSQPPVWLARLAPLVLRAARDGDPDALGLVERAADHLLDTLGTVRPSDSDLPVVLAGGALSPDSPLATAVRIRVAARWPAAPMLSAGNTAGAAAWLAARELGAPEPATLHRLLVSWIR